MDSTKFEFDYTFATRFKSFVEDIKTNCIAGDEERDYFISVASRLLKHQIDNATNESEIAYLNRCHDLKSDIIPIDEKQSEVEQVAEIDKPVNIYIGELSIERMKAIDIVSEKYSITKSSVREIFCKGADWALSIGRPEDEVRRTLKKGQK